MNLILLLIIMLCTVHGWWIPVLALAVLSLQMQIGALLGLGLQNFVVLNALTVVGVLIIRKRCAFSELSRLRSLMNKITSEARTALQLRRNRLMAATWVVFAVLFFFTCALGTVYGVDPYHLQRIDIISQQGISYYNTPDSRLNAGYLYELTIADMQLLPGVGNLLFRLSPFFALLGVALALILFFRGQFERFSIWGALLFLPLFVLHFRYFKNDVWIALFMFAVLLLIHRRERILLAGVLTGLALATKTTSYPLVFVGLIFLPYGEAFFRLRWRFALGIVAGVLAGGLAYTQVVTMLHYGSSLDPLQAGYVVRDFSSAYESVSRFLENVFIPRAFGDQITAYSYANGWGLLFPLIVLLYIYLLFKSQITWRISMMTAMVLLLFAASYRDAYIAQRMMIGAALFFMAITLQHTPASYSRFVQAGIVVSMLIFTAFLPDLLNLWKIPS